MTFHHLFVTAGYVIPVLETVPIWLPAFAVVAAVIVWATRARDRFQETAADAARAPLPQRVEPVIDIRSGTDQDALATCNAIWYATVRQGGQL